MKSTIVSVVGAVAATSLAFFFPAAAGALRIVACSSICGFYTYAVTFGGVVLVLKPKGKGHTRDVAAGVVFVTGAAFFFGAITGITAAIFAFSHYPANLQAIKAIAASPIVWAEFDLACGTGFATPYFV